MSSTNSSISNTDENVKFSLKEPESKLAENGVAYSEYESGNEQSRVDTLNSFDDVKFSRKESVDDFNQQDYNEIKISTQEYNKLYSEAMTWDANKTNQILWRAINGYRYYYYLDDNYSMTVVLKEQSQNIHEVTNDVNRYSKRFSKRFAGIRSNGRYGRGGNFGNENGRTLREDVRNAEGQIRRERRGNRAGYAENGNNDNLQEKKRYSVKEEPIDYNTILQENDELAQMNEDLKHMLKITFIWIFKLLNLCTIYS